MRADRLLSMLMLLETKGRMTAIQLAKELEVSERTIYRDITALNTAGIPVYTESGPGGGISLVESYHTNLTGLSTEEVKALAMLSIPDPLIKLGVGIELKSALLKLSAAFPSKSRSDENRIRQRIHLDTSRWFEPDEPIPHLQTIQQALWQEQKLHLTWKGFKTIISRTLSPYGLVAKSNTWYLIAAQENHIRTLRVSKILSAEILEETFNYPNDFDIVAFWNQWSENFAKNRSFFPVDIRISPDLAPFITQIFGTENKGIITEISSPDERGWIRANIRFSSFSLGQ